MAKRAMADDQFSSNAGWLVGAIGVATVWVTGLISKIKSDARQSSALMTVQEDIAEMKEQRQRLVDQNDARHRATEAKVSELERQTDRIEQKLDLLPELVAARIGEAMRWDGRTERRKA